MVHDYSQNGTSAEQHPLVNIYCGGKLVATYGQAPNQLTGFNKGGGWGLGSMWRVADVTSHVDSSGHVTSCDVEAIHPPGQQSGYYVTQDDTHY
jgi:hypothetical protein